MAAHALWKYEFMEDEKYHNLMRWLLYFFQKTDTSSLAQFYFADEELNLVAAELDSFDGRKDPERCTLLGNNIFLCVNTVWLSKTIIRTCRTSHCEIKSLRLWPIWKPIPIRFFKSLRIFSPFYNTFYEEININHTLLCLSQASKI